ncbi:hypothetical protein BDV23DRAFT_82565 [Aspergillus alliaceus]|uniref:Uncharacterized protein n=1 Tax=Petromyces alliaceus TaxID=209559 RepID=A0A5N7C8X5_PETAA|nr:hypothetical protein BDV23DRAFT_82565 [Aspergillus alliaceus]
MGVLCSRDMTAVSRRFLGRGRKGNQQQKEKEEEERENLSSKLEIRKNKSYQPEDSILQAYGKKEIVTCGVMIDADLAILIECQLHWICTSLSHSALYLSFSKYFPRRSREVLFCLWQRREVPCIGNAWITTACMHPILYREAEDSIPIDQLSLMHILIGLIMLSVLLRVDCTRLYINDYCISLDTSGQTNEKLGATTYISWGTVYPDAANKDRTCSSRVYDEGQDQRTS